MLVVGGIHGSLHWEFCFDRWDTARVWGRQAFSKEDLYLWEMSVPQGKQGCASNLEWAMLVGGALVNSSGNKAGRLLGFPGQGDQAVDMCINISAKRFTTS